jgi:phthiocerol/phenolphthiocerol synthesis type-I polyketide synthase E
MDQINNSGRSPRLAIIGMAIRCPGAKNVTEFWSNLKNGVESISFFSEEELREAGIADAILKLPTFIRAGAPLQGLELFDAEYFNYSAREAEFIDPQQRVFLECAVEALETAGVDPGRHQGQIGVFAGEGQTLYGYQILANRSVIGVERQMAVIGNDKDYLATRTSYKLGLRGPSITVQCACSTATVAVHLAIQSLLSYECDLALAGGVSVSWLRGKGGYHFVEGGILSRDGHTRAFDANASGTVFADGVAILVLKRLEDAVVDGDDIQATVLGTAVNNDGSNKISYTAPSIEGQAAVLSEAMAVGGVAPETIGYVEAHGTGTALGDPIEIEALKRVFQTATDKKQFCGVGSLKTNVGHLNTISGLAGTIKAALCVKTGEIPPSLHFETPNPKIDFANSPFYVPTKLTKWSSAGPRRAAISAFGIGGTNTEVIIEEPPAPICGTTAKSSHVAIVSAKSKTALEAACARLAEYLRKCPEENIADVCHTLATGRTLHSHARAVICNGALDAASALVSDDPSVAVGGLRAVPGKPVTFLFPGQGSQHIYMGRELYREEPVFRHELDKCAELLREHSGIDLRAMLFPGGEATADEAERLLRNTRYTQPAIFSVSYALAKLWMSLGVRPAIALGHSIGEFVAACFADVFSLKDGLRAVAERGRLIQSMPGGAMLAVMRPANEVEAHLPPSISIAAMNAPTACVASGPYEDIAALERRFGEIGISCTRLHTSHAFHSAMLEPAVGPFIEFMRSIELKSPQMPYISNITGEWITDEQATNPNYWGAHMRAPVLFHKGLSCIHNHVSTVFLEVGPGRSLGTLARSLGREAGDNVVQSSMPHAAARGAGEVKAFLRAAAELWVAGVPVDWSRRYEGERRRKRPLPTYPFERKRYWILDEEQSAPAQPEAANVGGGENAVVTPLPTRAGPYAVETATWKRVQHAVPSRRAPGETKQAWLVFVAHEAVDQCVAEALRGRGDEVTIVEKGAGFARLGDGRFTCDVSQEADFDELCAGLAKVSAVEQRLGVVYFCDPSRIRPACQVALDYRREVDDKINAPIALIRSLMRHAKAESVSLTIVTRDGQEITGAETIDPMMSLAIGPCLAGMHEYPGLNCRVVDIEANAPAAAALAQQLAADLAEPRQSSVTAYRGNARWARTVEPIAPYLLKNPQAALRKGGVYLITGGLGALGLALARHLAENYQANLILTGRTQFPAREQWTGIKAASPEDNRLVRIIRGIEEIEAAGGRVIVGSADVRDLARMQEVVREAADTFGEIHGVIHGAGIPGNTPIGLKTLQEVDEVIAPKILGLAVLEQIFADRDLDFLALFSSTSALWGRVGQVDYTAANAYLDAYAVANWGKSRWPTVSINWDNWREVGMAVDTLRAGPGQAKPQKLKIGLSTADGVRAFGQALAARHPQVIVRASRAQQFKAVNGSAVNGATGEHRTLEFKPKPKAKAYPRPALAQPYQAPATELETNLAKLWSELLMITPIGRDDNFFELGGHSLLGLQLLPRIREKYQVALEPRELFANPTIAKLAADIKAKLPSDFNVKLDAANDARLVPASAEA